MAERVKRDQGPTGSPTQIPATNAPYQNPDQHSWILQAVMELKGSMGEVKQAVSTLQTDSTEMRKQVNRISHIMYAASVIGAILIAFGIFLANKVADALIAGLKSGH